MFGLQKVSTYCVSNRIVPKCAQIGVVEPNGSAKVVAATITNKVSDVNFMIILLKKKKTFLFFFFSNIILNYHLI